MDCFMCYGPVVPDGYGACYNPHEDYILCVISSFNHCDQTTSDHFALTLEESFLEMKDVCIQSAKVTGTGAGTGTGQGEGKQGNNQQETINNNNKM